MYNETQETSAAKFNENYIDRYNNPLVPDQVKTGGIPRAYSNLSLNLEAVQKYVSDLESRLAGVLRAEQPTPSNGACESRDVTCGLAQSIQDDAERLGIVARRLESILSRIDL